MATTLNVFELTSTELSKSNVKESVNKSAKKKTVKESAKFGRRMRKPQQISANKIRLESLSFFEDADEDIVDYTPDEDVILVIDPEMDEAPETPEEAEEAAEDLVGDFVCKCAICGANYVCDHMEVNEDLESEEGECPVCGETGEQIIVGEIAPAEEEPVEDEEPIEDEEPAEDEEPVEDDSDVDVNINIDVDDDFLEDEEEEEEDYSESVMRAKRRTALRRESVKRNVPMARASRRSVINKESKRPVARKSRVAENRLAKSQGKMYDLDEVTLNRMFTKFAKENYDNVRFVKITNAKCKGTQLTLEGTVVTKKGNKRSTKFVCERFVPSAKMTASFKEIGAFTENATSKNNAFTISFNVKNNVITPTALKYSYKVKENRAQYLVHGNVMNESFKRTK